MQSSNASDERRFDGHEKIENVTVTIHWTLGSRKGRNTDGRLRAGCRTSVLPEPLKSIRRKRCVALGAHNRPVAQVTLNGPRVLPVIGKLVAAGMAQHVAVDQETEFCGHASPSHHALVASHTERCATLADEHVKRFDLSLPLQPP
jgi:hypothetical protein